MKKITIIIVAVMILSVFSGCATFREVPGEKLTQKEETLRSVYKASVITGAGIGLIAGIVGACTYKPSVWFRPPQWSVFAIEIPVMTCFGWLVGTGVGAVTYELGKGAELRQETTANE